MLIILDRSLIRYNYCSEDILVSERVPGIYLLLIPIYILKQIANEILNFMELNFATVNQDCT